MVHHPSPGLWHCLLCDPSCSPSCLAAPAWLTFPPKWLLWQHDSGPPWCFLCTVSSYTPAHALRCSFVFFKTFIALVLSCNLRMSASLPLSSIGCFLLKPPCLIGTFIGENGDSKLIVMFCVHLHTLTIYSALLTPWQEQSTFSRISKII